MTPERWLKVKEIFDATIQRDPTQRSAFLAKVSGDDDELREEVESLIASHEKDGSFIDSPAYEAAVKLIVDERAELKPGEIVGSSEMFCSSPGAGMREAYRAEDRRQ